MKARTCESCNAFAANGQKNADGSTSGECRAKAPVVVAHWFTTHQGLGWQGGYPPTNSAGWCREHESKTRFDVIDGTGAVPQ